MNVKVRNSFLGRFGGSASSLLSAASISIVKISGVCFVPRILYIGLAFLFNISGAALTGAESHELQQVLEEADVSILCICFLD